MQLAGNRRRSRRLWSCVCTVVSLSYCVFML